MSERTDVVIVGLGWAGSVIATELALAGYRVTALERGSDFVPGPDGRGGARNRAELLVKQSQRVSRETFTLRHAPRQTAFPLRMLGSFLAGEGVGGAGVLWGGNSPRLSPGAFQARTLARSELGFDRIDEGVLLADWPISFADLEPDYQRFEQAIGVAGVAGVLLNGSGTDAERAGEEIGGNPFEGPRSGEYPAPPARLDARSRFVAESARAIGLHPYLYPTAAINSSYTNQYGVTRGPADVGQGHAPQADVPQVATPLNTLLPAARASGKLTVVTGANVRRLVLSNGRVTSVVYTSADGDHEISATAVVLSAWTLNNVRLLLLSGIGEPYDPATGTGAVGRSYGNHLRSGVTAFFDGATPPAENPAVGFGIAISDFDPHGWRQGPPYVGGALLASYGRRFSSGHRAAAPDTLPRWGPDWVRAVHREQASALSVYLQGDAVPQRDRYLDLDPVYRDAGGDPLLRITFNWSDNDRRLAADIGARAAEIFKAAGARHINAPMSLPEYYDTIEYQNSHGTGGAIAGEDRRTSSVDRDLRSWDAENLWVVGASAFPTAGANNPTITVGALAYRASAAIRARL